jgi:hypothetical protein
MAKPYRRRKGKRGPFVGNFRVTINGRDLNLGTKDGEEAHQRARLAAKGKWPPAQPWQLWIPELMPAPLFLPLSLPSRRPRRSPPRRCRLETVFIVARPLRLPPPVRSLSRPIPSKLPPPPPPRKPRGRTKRSG